MYNGIGLDTVRGSGTNGYVTRNIALLRNVREKVDYKTEEEVRKLDALMTRGPNKEILAHERKRKVELKCMEMQELMEEQEYTEEEIETKVTTFRKMLMAKEGVTDRSFDTDESGRPIVKESHQVAEASQLKNDAMKAALGISECFKDGSSFQTSQERKTKEEQAKSLAMAKKQYNVIREQSSSSRSPSPPVKKSKKKKKKSSSSGTKRSRADSESPERKKKKKKKHRRD